MSNVQADSQKKLVPRVFVLGLAGAYCAGKSRLGQILEVKGAFQIEVDRLGHKALEAQAEAVIQAFGSGVEEPNSLPGQPRINRKKLGALVFNNPEALARLEAISHPQMCLEVEKLVEAQRKRPGKEPVLIVINAAILFQMNLHKLCNASVFLQAPFLLRWFRAMRRDGLGPRKAWKRIRSLPSLLPQNISDSADTRTIRVWSSRQSLKAVEDLLEERWLLPWGRK